MKQLLLIASLLTCTIAMAQDDVEYNWEIGAGAGLATYMGDFNSSILSGENTAPSVSLILRRTFNPYSHLRFTLGYTTMKGKSDNVNTFYPDYNTQIYNESARPAYSFSNTLIDLNAIYEYNFWPYGTGRDYRGAQRITPFIAIGAGFSYANCSGGWYDASLNLGVSNGVPELFGEPKYKSGGAFALNLPVGVGVKYKVGDRTNLSLSWQCHFSLTDRLDGVKDPYRISSDGLFKNTDCYSNLQLAITYSFGPKCKTCMNSDW